MNPYTFVCLAEKQVAILVETQDLADSDYRLHALGLLRAHGAAVAIEVWRDESFVEVVARAGVRPRGGSTDGPADNGSAAGDATFKSADE